MTGPKISADSEEFAAIEVVTGARLHFGLLDTVAPFGGAGVMVEQPETRVLLKVAARYRCESRESRRIKAIAQRLAERMPTPDKVDAVVKVLSQPPPHSGFGSGTQLALAVAEGLCRLTGYEANDDELWRDLAARGKRSAVGIHGYFHGGLIFEAPGKKTELNPIQQRLELPHSWRVGLFLPEVECACVSGEFESTLFQQLGRASDDERTQLRCVLEQQLLPAARSADFEAFAEAVSHYNRLSGLLFEKIQGGPYHGPVISELIARLQRSGAVGVGQSSWGPGVFAWFPSQQAAQDLVDRLAFNDCTIRITSVRNRPRSLEQMRAADDIEQRTITVARETSNYR